MKKFQVLVPQNLLEVIIFVIISLLILFILFPEKIMEGSMPSIGLIQDNEATAVSKNIKRNSAFSGKSGSHNFPFSEVANEKSEHAEIPSVLTIYIMDKNGDPTTFPADIIFENEEGQKSYSAIDGKLKLEVFQGSITVRARFKVNNEFRVTLPVRMDIEPKDDEELDLMLIPALRKVFNAEFKSFYEGVKITTSEPSSAFNSKDILFAIQGTQVRGMKLEVIDSFLGDCMSESKFLVSIEEPDGSIRELNFSSK